MSVIEPINATSLQQAAEVIAQGGLIVLPTDTVYGIACDPYNMQAIERLYQAKQRSYDKPLQILLADIEQLASLGLTLSPALALLSDKLLPGALSPIAQALPSCSLATLAHGTQAIRVPQCQATHDILSATGVLAASSANKSSQPSARSAQEAYEYFGDSVQCYLDAGEVSSDIASTVVADDMSDSDGIRIMRDGAISQHTVREILHEYGQAYRHRGVENSSQDLC